MPRIRTHDDSQHADYADFSRSVKAFEATGIFEY
jgi:hypothetical protein